MDQNQLPALLSLLKGQSPIASAQGAQAPSPTPMEQSPTFMDVPQQYLPSSLGGTPQTGSPFMDVPSSFLPQGFGQ